MLVWPEEHAQCMGQLVAQWHAVVEGTLAASVHVIQTFVLYSSLPLSSSSAFACFSSASFWRSRFCTGSTGQGLRLVSSGQVCWPQRRPCCCGAAALACSSRSRVDMMVDIRCCCYCLLGLACVRSASPWQALHHGRVRLLLNQHNSQIQATWALQLLLGSLSWAGLMKLVLEKRKQHTDSWV